jgi:hypothetical protein
MAMACPGSLSASQQQAVHFTNMPKITHTETSPAYSLRSEEQALSYPCAAMSTPVRRHAWIGAARGFGRVNSDRSSIRSSSYGW